MTENTYISCGCVFTSVVHVTPTVLPYTLVKPHLSGCSGPLTILCPVITPFFNFSLIKPFTHTLLLVFHYFTCIFYIFTFVIRILLTVHYYYIFPGTIVVISSKGGTLLQVIPSMWEESLLIKKVKEIKSWNTRILLMYCVLVLWIVVGVYRT